jgi:hypothetical protein
MVHSELLLEQLWIERAIANHADQGHEIAPCVKWSNSVFKIVHGFVDLVYVEST